MEPSSLVVGRHSISTGLLILSLVYRKKVRATGMLILCEVVAETVRRYVAYFGCYGQNGVGLLDDSL